MYPALRFPEHTLGKESFMAWGGGGAPEAPGIWRPQRLPKDEGHFVWRGCPGRVDSGCVGGGGRDRVGVAAILEIK